MSASALLAAVITVSDRASRGERRDESGPRAAARLEEHELPVVGVAIVADERTAIVDAVRDAAQAGVRVLVLTGGTGLSSRDITPEAIGPLLTRRLDGVADEIRRRGLAAAAPGALLSRPVAGVVHFDGCAPMLVAAGPGSPSAASDTADVLGAIARHAIALIDDDASHAQVHQHAGGRADIEIAEGRRGRRARHADASTGSADHVG